MVGSARSSRCVAGVQHPVHGQPITTGTTTCGAHGPHSHERLSLSLLGLAHSAPSGLRLLPRPTLPPRRDLFPKWRGSLLFHCGPAELPSFLDFLRPSDPAPEKSSQVAVMMDDGAEVFLHATATLVDWHPEPVNCRRSWPYHTLALGVDSGAAFIVPSDVGVEKPAHEGRSDGEAALLSRRCDSRRRTVIRLDDVCAECDLVMAR